MACNVYVCARSSQLRAKDLQLLYARELEAHTEGVQNITSFRRWFISCVFFKLNMAESIPIKHEPTTTFTSSPVTTADVGDFILAFFGRRGCGDGHATKLDGK